MYQIKHITDKEGVAKAEPSGRAHLGCVLFRCRYDGHGDPCNRYIRTSLVQNWKKDPDSGRIIVETMNSIYYMDPVKD